VHVCEGECLGEVLAFRRGACFYEQYLLLGEVLIPSTSSGGEVPEQRFALRREGLEKIFVFVFSLVALGKSVCSG
jgi:hypothetical protein